MNELNIRKTPLDLNHDVNIDVEPGVLAEENMQIIHDIDKVVENVIKDAAQYSQKFQAIATEICDIGNIAGEWIEKSGVLNKGTAAIASIGVQAGAAIAATLYQSYQEMKNEQRKQKALEELKLRRKLIAKKKLSIVKDYIPKARNTMEKTNKLFSLAFDKKIFLDNEAKTNMTVKDFKRTFATYIKARYNFEILSFAQDEMEAWAIGLETSLSERPDWTGILDKEISTWPQKLLGNNMSWDAYMSNVIENGLQEYPISVYLMLTEPFLLANYIGVEVTTTDNCKDGIIKSLSRDESQSINSQVKGLLEDNSYYKGCKEIALDYKDEPEFGIPLLYHIIEIAVAGTFITFAGIAIWKYLNGYVFIIVACIFYLLVPVIILKIIEFSMVGKLNEYYETVKSARNREYDLRLKSNEIKVK